MTTFLLILGAIGSLASIVSVPMAFAYQRLKRRNAEYRATLRRTLTAIEAIARVEERLVLLASPARSGRIADWEREQLLDRLAEVANNDLAGESLRDVAPAARSVIQRQLTSHTSHTRDAKRWATIMAARTKTVRRQLLVDLADTDD